VDELSGEDEEIAEYVRYLRRRGDDFSG